MKNKILKYLINCGNVIATLLLFAPPLALGSYKYTDKWWIWLIFSILYDIYYYDNMQKMEYITKQVKHIEEVKKGKSIYKTEKDQLISYKIICENIVNEFKDNLSKK